MTTLPLWICPPADGNRLESLWHQLDEWTGSPALWELVSLSGGSMSDLDLPERLEWLDEFSEAWDFRRKARERATAAVGGSQDAAGSSRWEITETGLGPEVDARIVELADRLGLVSNVTPSRRDVDYLIVLGGARLSNLLRPQYAAELIRESAVRPNEIILLGGSRGVMDTERDATDSYAPEAATEFDLLTMGRSSCCALCGAEADFSPVRRLVSGRQSLNLMGRS